jgi:hypothetical protein
MNDHDSSTGRETRRLLPTVITLKGEPGEAETAAADKIVSKLLSDPDQFSTFAINVPPGAAVGPRPYAFYVQQIRSSNISEDIVNIGISSIIPISSIGHAETVFRLMKALGEAFKEQHPLDIAMINFVIGKGEGEGHFKHSGLDEITANYIFSMLFE